MGSFTGTGHPGQKKATTKVNVPPRKPIKYEITIEETNFLQKYAAYVRMDGVRYSMGRQDYEKKFVGKTVEEVERQAKAYIDEKRKPPPEPDYVKRFLY